MNAELTAENRPAYVLPGSASSTEYRDPTTYEDEGRVQVVVVFTRVIFIKLFGLLLINSEEVGPQVIGPQWIEEFLKGGMEAE